MRIRQLRLDADKTQREVAIAIGCKESTYANTESTRTKRLTERRVLKLAALYGLSPGDTDQLLAGWRELPISEYSRQNAPKNERRRVIRDKVRAHDEFKAALLDMATLVTTAVPDPNALCTCPEVDIFAENEPCELCNALQLLGLPGWTDLDDVVARLAVVQEAMAA